MKTCFVFVNVSLGKESESLLEINKIPNAKVIFETNVAAYDFIIKVEANTDEKLTIIISKIRKIKFIRSTLTLIEKSSWRIKK